MEENKKQIQKDKFKVYYKAYYEANKERIKEYQQEHVVCGNCNKNITKWNWNKHSKTKGHMKKVEYSLAEKNFLETMNNLQKELDRLKDDETLQEQQDN